MRRLLNYGTICCLATLVVTSVFSIGNGIDLFMTSSFAQDIIRVGLIGVLVITLFVDEHPRTQLLPGLFATISAMLAVYTVWGVVEYSLQIFDALTYLSVSAVLMSEALSKESRVEPLLASRPAI